MFNMRKDIFKHILEVPLLKETFFKSLELSAEDSYLDIDPEREYSPDFIVHLTESSKTTNISLSELKRSVKRPNRQI